MNTCRLCKQSALYLPTGEGPMIKYGTRHYAHAGCALKRWGEAFFARLGSHQLSQFPYLIARRHGLDRALAERIKDQTFWEGASRAINEGALQ
jgi:hypothetical protein